MKHKRYPLWRPVVLALLSVILGLRLYTWNANHLTGNQLPMPFGYGLSVVLSGSMEPTLSVDDLVLIHETDDLNIGDVVVYQSGEELIIHRIVARNGDTIVTKGDANEVEDNPIDVSAVKGCMVGSVAGMGKLVRVLKKPWVIWSVLAAAFLLMEWSYRRERTTQNQDREAILEEIRRLKEES